MGGMLAAGIPPEKLRAGTAREGVRENVLLINGVHLCFMTRVADEIVDRQKVVGSATIGRASPSKNTAKDNGASDFRVG
jgi:hypothetical protein